MDWAAVVRTAIIMGALGWFFYPSRSKLNSAMTDMGEFLKSLRGKASLTAPGGFNAQLELADHQNVTGGSRSLDKPLSDPVKTPVAIPPPEREALKMIEESIKRDLEGQDLVSQISKLTRFLATRTLFGSHEFVYNRIFGSQISFLKTLNSVGKMPLTQAGSIYSSAVEQYPDFYKAFPFENWLGFLEQQPLITREGDNVKMHTFGRDFLLHLVEQGLLENKLL